MIINWILKEEEENLKFRSIQIIKRINIIKEMEKKGNIFGLRKLIHRHKTENWHIFLKYWQKLRIKNNVKEYFFKIKILYLY